MDRGLDGYTNRWTNGCAADRWMNKQKDGQLEGQMDEYKDGQTSEPIGRMMIMNKFSVAYFE